MASIKIQEKSLLKLTIPIFLELLLMTVVGNVDIIMVSKYSEKGVGVLGGMTQILQTQNIIFSFISIGTGILISQYIGAKKDKKIYEVIWVSLILTLILGVIIGGAAVISAHEILRKVKLSEELIDLGLNYFKLVGGLCIFQGVTLTASVVLRSFGFTKIPLLVNVAINLLNILGNGMFLFGWLGAPILGVTGVGISTVVSRMIGVVIIIRTLKVYCKFSINSKKISKFPMDILKYIAKIGVPSGAEHLCWNTAQIVILSMVNTMGTENIAARTYLNLITSFLMMFSIALGQGTAILNGRLIGAKKIKEAYLQCIHSVKISMIAVIFIVVTLLICQNPILNFFTTDPVIIKICKKVLWTFLFIETGRTFNIVIINSLHAAGDVKFPMFAGIFCMFGVAVTLSYILGIKLEMALIGIWIANGADEWIRGLIMLKRWKGMQWSDKGFI